MNKWATGLHAFSDPSGFDPPQAFPILTYGTHTYSCNGTECTFDFSLADAERICAAFRNRKMPLVIDYEHQTLSGKEAPAAGWIDALEVGESALMAQTCRWTEKATAYLKSGEYAYFSPVLFFNDREIEQLHSVALTNHPALYDSVPLHAPDTAKSVAERVEDALKRGLLLCAQRTWALTFAETYPDAFGAFCNTAPVIGPVRQAFSDFESLNLAPARHTQTTQAMLHMAGLSPEQITRFQKGVHAL